LRAFNSFTFHHFLFTCWFQLSTSDHYRGEKGRVYHEQKRGIPEAAFPWVARHRAQKISPYVKATDVVFEYGVGWGWNVAELKCARKIGFDIADAVRENVKARGIEFIRPEDLPNESVDVIICHHTLEHVENPMSALTQMRTLLKPGGKLLLFVPFEREAKYTRFDPNEPNHHLFSWNCQTLGNLVQDCGYKVSEAAVVGFGYDRFAAVWSARFGLGDFGFRFIRSCVHLAKPAFEVRVVATRE
jgi:SAM-dependent methyltransferase